MVELRGYTTEGLIEELERRKVSFDKYKELGKFEKFQEDADNMMRINDHLLSTIQQIADKGSGNAQVIALAALKEKSDGYR